jgi:hypothetical protein
MGYPGENGEVPLTLPSSQEAVSQYEKPDFSEKGKRWSGGKDLERQPLTLLIQTCQGYENVRFYASGDFP